MTGAMYAAIAGLRTHMQNLNVIGNNVANVNTYGYKSARSVFKTALYTTLSGGSDGTTVVGGANPSQIGYGSTMGSIGIDMSTGNYAVTGRPMDLMLDGEGFFITGDKTIAGQFTGTGADQTVLNGMKLTRVGNFEFGADGYLAKEDGSGCVYGFMVKGTDAAGNPIFSDQLVPIRYPSIQKNDDGSVTLVYCQEDGQGGAGGAGTATRFEEPKDDDGNLLPKAAFYGVTIDKNTGIITGTCKDTGELATIGVIAVGQVKNPNGVTNLGDNYYQAGKGSGGMSVSLLGGAARSMFGTDADADGTVYYMNGELLGNNQGANDDRSDVCRLLSAGETRVLQSGLEMSKTDLAQEISQMILTQRGYQANTRIITVTDSMLEELVNMKR